MPIGFVTENTEYNSEHPNINNNNFQLVNKNGGLIQNYNNIPFGMNKAVNINANEFNMFSGIQTNANINIDGSPFQNKNFNEKKPQTSLDNITVTSHTNVNLQKKSWDKTTIIKKKPK